MKIEKVIQVFVGSPGDVTQERKRAFEVIECLNNDVLLPDGWRFKAVGWDKTHYPKIAWLSPQEAIDQGIPKPGDCEVAVFLFWKRVGTPLPPGTFAENSAGSNPTGSLWEFYQAMESSKQPWVLVYRCSRTPEMSPQDLADPEAFGKQLKGVQDFFATFKDDQSRFRADHADYTDVDDFEQRFAQDLKSYIKRLSLSDGPSTQTGKTKRSSPELVPRTYLRRLMTEVARVDLLGLDLKESITNGLPQVYVPAVTNPEQESKSREEVFRERRRDLVLHRLGERSLYLPGDPGSGKSTFCEWVAYTVANGAVPAHEIAPPDDLQEQLPDTLADRLPVLVRLRDFWGHMGCDENQGDWSQPQLEAAISTWLDETRPQGLTSEVFDRNLAEGNLLLLLDGVDEVPEEHHSGSKTVFPRQAVLSGLANALPSWLEAKNRIMVTSRPYGLRAVDRDRLRLPVVGLLGLDEDLQRLFTARWYAAADHARWEEYADGMAAELEQRRELDELRRNPLLLTALCVKFKEGKRLPQDVYNLYDSVVNQVLFNRFRRSDRERTRVRWRLEAVALGMHHGIDDQSVRQAPEASLSLDELDRILAYYAEQNPSTEGGAAQVLERRDELLERSGLFLPRGEYRAEFYHQDFRDYLAAERWAREGRSFDSALTDFGHDRNWRRMLGFLFAKVIETSGGIDRPLSALKTLDDKISRDALSDDAAAALLLADCLEIAAGKAGEQGLPDTWAERLRRICNDSLDVVTVATDRNALFLALGRLGWDDRRGVGLDAQGLPDIHWLPVPNSEKPEFYIARYPVTQDQFQAFVDAEDGHRDLRWWEGFEDRRQESSRSTWPEPTAPRTDVDWFEAVAFCRWLTQAGAVPHPGWVASLPTDAEWRRAYVAREDDDYPWQGEPDPQRHANFDQSGVDRTSAVGVFPEGAAVTGALDMAGNVDEWCLDERDNLGEVNIDASDDARVLRGGSWYYALGFLLSGDRFRCDPVYRYYGVGFRLVCRPPSSADH